MRTIRLAYVVSTLGRTGPTRQLLNLIKHLDRERFQAEVITMSPNPPGNLEQDFLDLGITVHTLALSRLAGVFFGRSRWEQSKGDTEPKLVPQAKPNNPTH